MLVSRGRRDTRCNGPLPPAISVLCKAICTGKGLHLFDQRKIDQFKMPINLISLVPNSGLKPQQKNTHTISVGSMNQPISIGTE